MTLPAADHGRSYNPPETGLRPADADTGPPGGCP